MHDEIQNTVKSLVFSSFAQMGKKRTRVQEEGPTDDDDGEIVIVEDDEEDEPPKKSKKSTAPAPSKKPSAQAAKKPKKKRDVSEEIEVEDEEGDDEDEAKPTKRSLAGLLTSRAYCSTLCVLNLELLPAHHHLHLLRSLHHPPPRAHTTQARPRRPHSQTPAVVPSPSPPTSPQVHSPRPAPPTQPLLQPPHKFSPSDWQRNMFPERPRSWP